MPPALRATKVSKRFTLRESRPRTLRESFTNLLTGRFTKAPTILALHDVSFVVEQGRTFGIIGHNGAGKSTLLRLLCGLSLPTSGVITQGGRVSGILELGGGFNPDLTGRQNVMTAGILNGLTTREVKAREERIISFAELEEAIDRPTRTYSSGMYLRLAFAAAIEFEPSILVLDEVLAVGDERFQKKCLERITRLKQEGTTLIITSHSAEQIQLLCEDVLVLEEGQVAMQGDPQSSLDCYHDLLRRRTEKRVAQLSGQSSVSSVVVTEQGHHQGTQEASISNVRVYDVNGKETGSVRNSESLAIELEYRLAAPLRDFAVTLGVFSGTQVKCFETSLASIKSLCGILPSQGTIRCELKSLPLLTGSYFINVGLYPTDWGYMYDYHWQMHSIHIVDEKAERRWDSGVVSVDHRWSGS